MDSTLDQLRELRGKAAAKLARLQQQLEAAEKEHADLDTALRVIERLQEPTPAGQTNTGTPNANSQLILSYIGFGEDESVSPKEVVERLSADGHYLGPDLVRTQLWRMARRGTLESDAGRYWKPAASDDRADDFENLDAGPQAPVRQGFGGFADDLDDDVPF